MIPIISPSDSPFKIIYADITHRCNMACANCYVPNRQIEDMNLEKFEGLISALPFSTEVRLIGGEPTLNPKVFEFIESTIRCGHRPVLVTNGLKLRDLDYCRKLKTSGLQNVYVSFSGFDDDRIYLETDQMACAKAKLQAIENLNRCEFDIGLGCLIVKGLNSHLFSPILEFAAQTEFVKRVNFRNIGKIGRHRSDPESHLSMKEMIQLVSEASQVRVDKILKLQRSPHQVRFSYFAPNKKKLRIKLTDWQPPGQSLPDPENLNRGRITQDFRLAPFFEHVKENEFGY